MESIPLYQKRAIIPNKDQQRYVGYKERGRIGERSNRRAKLQNILFNRGKAENNTNITNIITFLNLKVLFAIYYRPL